MTRKEFTKTALASAFVLPKFQILASKPKLSEEIIGHGDFRYRLHKNWGSLDPEKFPIKNCHEMVMDSRGRLIMITDETKNNILVYDKSGKLLESWGNSYTGGHGLTLWNEGGEDFLFICDPNLHKVFKTDLKGKVLLTIDHPSTIGEYKPEDPFNPTETAIAPNGDIYVADGYGSQYILQYDQQGKFIRKFGGKGDEDHQLQTAHGVAIDNRNGTPTLLVTSRSHNSFKRYSLDGKYLSMIFLPGAFVCRPVIKDENIYAGVCWSRLKYLEKTPNSGFITILDKNDRVVSNPAGTKPQYKNGKLQIMVQEKPLFIHCHDVCIDEDKNIYLCQWNAQKSYPMKLERV